MARTKGSKNKTVNQKIDEIIEEVQKLPVDETEKQEVIDEIEDLLGGNVEVVNAGPVIVQVTPEVVAQVQSKEKKLVGYHPISGKEIWE